jgi:hypothetical protein
MKNAMRKVWCQDKLFEGKWSFCWWSFFSILSYLHNKCEQCNKITRWCIANKNFKPSKQVPNQWELCI